MPSFDSKDRGSGCEVCLLHNGSGGAEVRGNTNTLENRGGGEEALHIRDAERICALCDGCGVCGLECAGEELDVCLFID